MAKFMTKYSNLTLTVRPTWIEQKGLQQVIHPGRSIEFQNGVYETEDADEIQFIRSHRWYGNRIVEVTETDEEAVVKASGVEIIELPCGYEGCDYIARGRAEDVAVRKLNAHRTKTGHWSENLPEVEAQ